MPIAVSTQAIELFILIALAALCALVIVCIAQVRTWRRDLGKREHYFAALESLSALSAELGATIRSRGEMLDRLPIDSIRVLGLDRSAIFVADFSNQVFNTVAASRASEPKFELKRQYSFDEMTLATKSLLTGEILYVEDVEVDAPGLNRQTAREANLRCVVHIPLAADGKSFGVLSLGNYAPKKFNEFDKRIMKLWGAQAAVIVHNARMYQQQAELLAELQSVLQQREQLFAAHTLLHQARSERHTLDMVVERAPGLLDVDACMVELRSDRGEATIAAATPGKLSQWIGQPLPPAPEGADPNAQNEPPRASRCRIRTTWAESDETVQAFSLARAGGAPLGRLILVRRGKGPITGTKFEFARLFCTRVAIAIENTRLHERARRDADTKAMLLRELNHRVKNNLAAIVGLLGLNQPALSEPARVWLDGMINRIRLMGRTHELFVGSGGEMPLQELVEEMRNAFLPVLRSDVELRLEFDGPAGCMLQSDRSVGLMIVLYELCSNAVRHGLADGPGIITLGVDCRQSAAVTIRVTDNGAGVSPQHEVLPDAAAPHVAQPKYATPRQTLAAGAVSMIEAVDAERPFDFDDDASSDDANTEIRRGGVGLELVCELMSREMRGQFTLRARPEGGTEAIVNFPLLRDEMDRHKV